MSTSLRRRCHCRGTEPKCNDKTKQGDGARQAPSLPALSLSRVPASTAATSHYLGVQDQAPVGRKPVLLSDYYFWGISFLCHIGSMHLVALYLCVCCSLSYPVIWCWGGWVPMLQGETSRPSVWCMNLCLLEGGLRLPHGTQGFPVRVMACLPLQTEMPYTLSTLQKPASAPWGDAWGCHRGQLQLGQRCPCSCFTWLLLLPPLASGTLFSLLCGRCSGPDS